MISNQNVTAKVPSQLLRRMAVPLSFAIALLLHVHAQAGVIQHEIQSDPHPDISFTNGMYSYSATNEFKMVGNATSLRRNGVNEEIVLGTYNGVNAFTNGVNWSAMPIGVANMMSGQFLITMNVDSTGNLIGTGSFEVRGALKPATGFSPNVSLLAGTITDLDASLFNNSDGNYGRLFLAATPVSGAFVDDGTFNSDVLIKIGGLDKTLDFSASFLTHMNASADVGRPVPEPTTFAIWAIGCSGLVVVRRRRRAGICDRN